MAPGGSAADGSAVGFDTLEEEEEKTIFFAKLQAEVSSPLDFSKLIGELDSTGSTTGKNLGYLRALDLHLEGGQSNEGRHEEAANWSELNACCCSFTQHHC